MAEEPPADVHFIYEYIIHPSLLPLRIVKNLITIPISLLLSAILLPLRILFLPLTSAASLLFTTRASTNPPGPLQFLVSALFFGTLAGLTLYSLSRLTAIALGALDPADPPFVRGPLPQKATHPLVPSSRQVRARILQQVRHAQQAKGVRDAGRAVHSLAPARSPGAREDDASAAPPATDASVQQQQQQQQQQQTQKQKQQQVSVKTEQQDGSAAPGGGGGVASSIDMWEDKWRRQQQQGDRREPRQQTATSAPAPPLSPSAGSGLSPVGRRTALPASQTIAEEDSDDLFYDEDEMDDF